MAWRPRAANRVSGQSMDRDAGQDGMMGKHTHREALPEAYTQEKRFAEQFGEVRLGGQIQCMHR
jgi:hypothetical protein